jgi:primary-amine oxidase
LAAYHQHIFSLRIDPELDGSRENNLIYQEAHALPMEPSLNPFGNGCVTKEKVVEKLTGLDLDSQKGRVFKITNSKKTSPVNGGPFAYKIMVPEFQPLLADPESLHFKRAEYVIQLITI